MKTEVAELEVTTEEAYKLAQKTTERVDEISVSVMNTELVGIRQVQASIDEYLIYGFNLAWEIVNITLHKNVNNLSINIKLPVNLEICCIQKTIRK